ncbi:MAG TPA: hypothetical protein VE175_11085, partial [Woeseiaceae bacterium]|nr:hypothetical protein [Woeseiaceae bacterium]
MRRGRTPSSRVLLPVRQSSGEYRRLRRIGCAVAVLLVALASHDAAALPDEPVVTRQEIRIRGRRLEYTAEAGRLAIRSVDTGEPHGYVFYVAYRVASPDRPRPLTFVWNGGPGSNSALLHFEAAGPKRLEGEHLVANDDTWLTATDLVFVDPVGTGFSRPARPEYADEFYGTVGDVASITEFVRAFRLLHDARDNPLFLVGESWGAGRAAHVGYQLLSRHVPVDGLVLISGGAGLEPPEEAKPLIDALRIAHLAATGLWHGRTARELGRDPAALQDAAVYWVRETYAPALARLDALSAAERESIAADLARYTGLPSSRIDRETLEIPPRQYREDLLQETTLDIFDMRRTEAPAPASPSAVLAYLRYELGYRTALPYLGLEDATEGYAPHGDYPRSVNERWNYATGPVSDEEAAAAIAEAMRTGSGPPKLGPPLPGTAEAVALNPKLRVLVAAGMYDSLANCPGNEALEEHL